mgnify:CR=1 FL=1
MNNEKEMKKLYKKIGKIFEKMTESIMLANEIVKDSEKLKSDVSILKAAAISVMLTDLNLLLSIDDPKHVSQAVALFHQFITKLESEGHFGGDVATKFNKDLKGKIISTNVSTKLQ